MKQQQINMDPVQSSLQSLKYHVGQNLDVKDSVGKWINAEVLFVGPQTIYVHYSGWSSKYDEEVKINSNRILTQWEPGKQIHLNNRIDAYHPIGGWLEARVIQIKQSQGGSSNIVRVHYFNYHTKYDREVNINDKNQVAIIGSRSKAYGMGKKRSKAAKNNPKIAELLKKLMQERTRSLKQSLEQRNLTIKKSAGDGNCLFRSISDQLYGDEKYYDDIRKICMDYIEHEKIFFQDYVAGDIEEYIEKKRRDGEWGDDIEIQAISEIYARPIEIYAFESKPIRTFHEQNPDKVNPIRLAYVGSCHYDSIKHKDNLDAGIMEEQFGIFEKLFASTYISGSQDAIRIDRNAFSNSTRIEQTIEQQLLAENRDQVKIEDQLTKALQASQTQALLSQIQRSEMQAVINKQQQQRLQQQLKKIEEKELEQAKKQSSKQNKQPVKPYWFDSVKALGYSDQEIWFAIEVNGFDPDAVQNFLLDNHYL